jgi:hypothetical protein
MSLQSGGVTVTNFKELVEAVQIAASDLEAAHSRTEIARCQETSALNILNDAQKKLDAAYAELKRTAPWSSDWACRTTQGGSVLG